MEFTIFHFTSLEVGPDSYVFQRDDQGPKTRSETREEACAAKSHSLYWKSAKGIYYSSKQPAMKKEETGM